MSDDTLMIEQIAEDTFTVEESTALLHYIWPEHPGARGMRPAPNPQQWLREYRGSESYSQAQHLHET